MSEYFLFWRTSIFKESFFDKIFKFTDKGKTHFCPIAFFLFQRTGDFAPLKLTYSFSCSVKQVSEIRTLSVAPLKSQKAERSAIVSRVRNSDPCF